MITRSNANYNLVHVDELDSEVRHRRRLHSGTLHLTARSGMPAP